MTSINNTDLLVLDQISKIVPINKYLCNIIFNYVNYTNETLTQLVIGNKNIYNKLKIVNKEITMDFDELTLKAMEFGFGGIRYNPLKYKVKTIMFTPHNFLDLTYLGLTSEHFQFIEVEFLIGMLGMSSFIKKYNN